MRTIDEKLAEIGRKAIDAELLRMLFLYDQETGMFSRIAPIIGHSAISAKPVGNRRRDGYHQIQINGKLWLTHRLAFLYMTGSHPENEVDHINGDKGDNRWLNLRAATRLQNRANTGIRSDNTSGYKGVKKKGSGWRASIRDGKRWCYLGLFSTPEDANAAYVAAATSLYGEFAKAS